MNSKIEMNEKRVKCDKHRAITTAQFSKCGLHVEFFQVENATTCRRPASSGQVVGVAGVGGEGGAAFAAAPKVGSLRLRRTCWARERGRCAEGGFQCKAGATGGHRSTRWWQLVQATMAPTALLYPARAGRRGAGRRRRVGLCGQQRRCGAKHFGLGDLTATPAAALPCGWQRPP